MNCSRSLRTFKPASLWERCSTLKLRSVVMTAQKIALPSRYQELTIVEGPPLHELLLSHSVAIANHVRHGTCFGPRVENRSVYFTTDTKWNAGGARVDFHFIASVEPYVSDGSVEYPAHKIGVAFSGLVSLENAPTVLSGFYCVSDCTGYIIVPISEPV